MRFPSKKELDEQRPQFPLLIVEDYELIITELEETFQNKYMAKPDKDGNIPQEPVINVQLEVVAFKDGEIPLDDENEDARGRKVFFNGRPESMGFRMDGTPSKTRCLVAYSTEQDINGKLDLDNWQNLVGKTIYASITKKENQKGQMKNRIERFVLPPRGKKTEEVKPPKTEEVPDEV